MDAQSPHYIRDQVCKFKNFGFFQDLFQHHHCGWLGVAAEDDFGRSPFFVTFKVSLLAVRIIFFDGIDKKYGIDQAST